MNATSDVLISERYLAEAARAITIITKDIDGLSRYGWTVDPSGEPLSQPCVATALAYLDCGPVLPVSLGNRRKWSGSYWLKHRAEDWGGMLGFAPYVANGDLICAVIWRGVPYRRDGKHSPNCTVAVRALRPEIDRLREPDIGLYRRYTPGSAGS